VTELQQALGDFAMLRQKHAAVIDEAVTKARLAHILYRAWKRKQVRPYASGVAWGVPQELKRVWVPLAACGERCYAALLRLPDEQRQKWLPELVIHCWRLRDTYERTTGRRPTSPSRLRRKR